MFFHTCSVWRRPRAACAFSVLVFLSADAFADISPRSLTHKEAIRRVLANNPELHAFSWRQDALRGELLVADQAAGYQLELETENLRRHSDGLEVTLALSSVVELGNKRGARTTVADSRLWLVESERQAAALDLIGRATQRFVGVLSLQEKLKVVDEAVTLGQTSVELARQRFERGAAAEEEVLRAEAALAQAQLRQGALAAQLVSGKVFLAAQWGEREADFAKVQGELYRFSEVAGFDELYRRAVAAPGIQVLADEARVRQAEIDLAIARSRADIQWRVGVRHFAEGGDAALVASISAPLGSAKRAGGHVQSAKAERQLVGSRREAALLSLRSTLFEAWLIRQQAAMQVAQLQQRILPALTRAVEQTRRAYEAGRYSYVEWAGVQRDLLEAKLALIDAATEVLLQQALIEQLTAEPLAARSISELNQD